MPLGTDSTSGPFPDDLISTTEAARLIPSGQPGRKTHTSTIVRWVKQGRLRGWRRGSRLLVSQAEVYALLRPEPVEVRPEVESEIERRERERRTDEVLRRHKIRR